MQTTMNAFTQNFLGNAPLVQTTIIAFLVLNPVLLYVAGPTSRAGRWCWSLSLLWQWR